MICVTMPQKWAEQKFKMKVSSCPQNLKVLHSYLLTENLKQFALTLCKNKFALNDIQSCQFEIDVNHQDILKMQIEIKLLIYHCFGLFKIFFFFSISAISWINISRKTKQCCQKFENKNWPKTFEAKFYILYRMLF